MEADLCAVKSLRGDSWCKIAIDDAEENRLKNGSVVRIERTVDEYVVVKAEGCDVLYPFGGCGSLP